MDYTTAGLVFKARKTVRYLSLYGFARTAVKIRGQYHVKRQYAKLPAEQPGAHPGTIGLIGCGNYAFSNIAYYLRKNYGRVIRAAMDVDAHRAASLFQRYKLAYYTTDVERLLSDPHITCIYIASNHASHAEYAIAALERGKHVHIEKPHVVSFDQLKRLCAAAQLSGKMVTTGFNRPHSDIGRMVKRALDEQEGAAMLNWFLAGHEIPAGHWYFKDEEGGRILGNLCHWIDFVYQMIPPENRYPIKIVPTRATASDCDVAVSYVFGDGSIAAITFSAKGHTFEGVRERFSAHKGNALIAMDDFQTLTIEIVEHKQRIRRRHRDHGHERAIIKCYEASKSSVAQANAADVAYLWESGELFLATREALEQNKERFVAGWTDQSLRS